MYKHCHTEQSIQRQRHIALTFVELLQTRSFSQVQVSELCRRAQVPRKAFYRYFDSKEDIIRYLADGMVSVCAQVELEPGAALGPEGREQCIRFFRLCQSWTNELRVLTSQECFGLFSNTFVISVVDRQLGYSRSNVDQKQKRLATIFSTAGYLNLLVYWTRHGFQESPEEMGGLLYQMFTEPLYK
ncbi:MAG: TetR/AcrR family transcriptional regulator [Candidatus Onthomonas sp.]